MISISNQFYMPGEFKPHAKCWMAWPVRKDLWYKNAQPAQSAFKNVAEAINQFEHVVMCVTAENYAEARKLLSPNIEVVKAEYDDVWMRDIGPTFVTNGTTLRGVSWNFNAWGGFYQTWEKDKQMSKWILEQEKLQGSVSSMVLEGGSIHVDGEGTLITTEECLLHPSRNPGMTKEEIESELKRNLGIEKIIWLAKGLKNEPIHGHVDNVCCFIQPTVLAVAWTDDTSDENYQILKNNYDQLVGETDAQGRSFTVHKIHIPAPMYTTAAEVKNLEPVNGSTLYKEGDRIYASYINFYPANGGVVIPSFGDEKYDAQALKQISKLFPDRKVVQVEARNIVVAGGGIHCITLSQPLS